MEDESPGEDDEYTDTGAKLSRFCPKAASLGFDAILKKRNLGAWRRSC